MKHTASPWVAIPALGTDDKDCGFEIESESPEYAADKYRGAVCRLHHAEAIGGITKAERNANARLIASAPNLLDALLCIAKSDDAAYCGRIARNAIREAIGEE